MCLRLRNGPSALARRYGAIGATLVVISACSSNSDPNSSSDPAQSGDSGGSVTTGRSGNTGRSGSTGGSGTAGRTGASGTSGAKSGASGQSTATGRSGGSGAMVSSGASGRSTGSKDAGVPPADARGADVGVGVACNALTTVANMKLGWNLGNSLDSVDASKSDTAVETAWGNPVVTPQLMKAVAAAGFGAVRVPVSWVGRFGPAPDYALSATFLKRVEEVVKYALDENLYVIINVHHDGGTGVAGQWITVVDGSGKVTAAHSDAVLGQFKKVWAQIAEHFRGYGDHLIFEGMNEIKVDYNAPKPEYFGVITGLNQAFVDAVRAGTGYNPSRCLVVPGYNTNIDHTIAGFVTPTDAAPGKLILSTHFYDPWSYAGEGSTHTWGAASPGTDSWGQEDWIRTATSKLKAKYIDKGLPVIWGEYGAVNQTGYETYRRYYMEYVTKATHDVGIVPFFWDNGSAKSGAEAFGLFDRKSGGVTYPIIVEAMVRAVTSSYALADVAKP